MNELFEREDEILSASKVGTDSKYNDLAVNTELMELHMAMALNGPRNAKQFKPMRETIGGFIFRSMAKSGLMVMSDKFNFRKVTINDVNVEVRQPRGRGLGRVERVRRLHVFEVINPSDAKKRIFVMVA